MSVILFTGCAQTTHFVQHGKTTTERDIALKKCDYEAQKATAGIVGTFETAYRHIQIRKTCMEIQGYRLEAI